MDLAAVFFWDVVQFIAAEGADVGILLLLLLMAWHGLHAFWLARLKPSVAHSENACLAVPHSKSAVPSTVK